MFKFDVDFKNVANIKQIFFVSYRNTSKLVALSCSYQQENACHRKSMKRQTVFRFYLSLKQSFSDSILCILISKYDKGAVVQI